MSWPRKIKPPTERTELTTPEATLVQKAKLITAIIRLSVANVATINGNNFPIVFTRPIKRISLLIAAISGECDTPIFVRSLTIAL